MPIIRKSNERGQANHGWLDSRHSFSFGDYHDPAHMGFSDLRVINQDRVQPGAGFGTHGHRDMEIITYVLSGALAHRDSMGNVETIQAGEVQRMTAGTGVQHSEFNASKTEPVEFLQIWVLPEKTGLAPGYAQIRLADAWGWHIVASQSGAADALMVHQDMTLWRGQFSQNEKSVLPLAANRSGWLQVVRGTVRIGDHVLVAGDAAAFQNEMSPGLAADTDAELLLFDLR
jgi:quercetin 2,3-dioxygenase